MAYRNKSHEEYCRKYREKNRERLRQNTAKRYKENPGKAATYRRANKKKLAARHKEWASSNREHLRDYANQDAQKSKARERSRFRRASLRTTLREIKVKAGCSKCGFNAHGAALDFHHPDNDRLPLTTTSPLKRWLAEIKKCVVLCSNCHRTLHAKEKKANHA